MSRVKIIGVGNGNRHDDGVGIFAARKLKKMVPGEVLVAEAGRDTMELFDSWRDAEKVILIDAVNGTGKVGKLYRFSANKDPLPHEFSNYSTHTFSLGQVIELARNLNELPTELIVYGIQGKNFKVGRGLSSELKGSVKQVISLILNELRQEATP